MEPFNQLGQSGNPPAFKDRKTGLTVFGILQILLGVLCLCMVPLMILGQAMASRTTGSSTQFRMLIPAMLVYAMMAGAFLTLGIGSLGARRWARAFSLILGWSWLAMGTLSLGMYSFLLPRLLANTTPGAPALPQSARVIITVISMAFIAVIFVLLPLVFVIFYQSKHVLATCETRNPAACWTDRRPLPILGLSAWILSGSVFLLIMPLAYHSVAPFFGTLLSGFPGTVLYLFIAALFLYLSRAVYRLNSKSWWAILVLMLLLLCSNLVTFSRVDIVEMYRQMGYSTADLQNFQTMNIFSKNWMLACSLLGFLPLLGFLLFVRRYFGASHTSAI